MQEVFKAIGKISKTDITVLIRGESGTGKELIAQSVHANSSRSNEPFIAINVAAIPHELLESELFGHEKGSFTGAQSQENR
jgi:two-component system nitrogen regulation response regulator GlnG